MKFNFPIRIKYKKQFYALMEALEKEGYLWVEGQLPTEYYPSRFPVDIEASLLYDKRICLRYRYR